MNVSVNEVNFSSINFEKENIIAKRNVLSRNIQNIATPPKKINPSNNNNIPLKNNNQSFKEYLYPICIYNQKPDPLKNFKMRLILSQTDFPKKYKYKPISYFKKSNSLPSLEGNGTFYNKSNQIYRIPNKSNKLNSLSSQRYSYINDNSFYHDMLLSQIEKRSNYYNKLQISIMKKNEFQKLEKLQHEIRKNNKQEYVIESPQRKYFPKMKTFLNWRINKIKYKRDTEINNDICAKNENNLPELINIKNCTNFKFHEFHDKKGAIRELDKPKEKILKMTPSKIRDMKIMAKINKINEPDIINIYKSVID